MPFGGNRGLETKFSKNHTLEPCKSLQGSITIKEVSKKYVFNKKISPSIFFLLTVDHNNNCK